MTCIASTHLQSLTDLLAKIKADCDALNKLASDYDKELGAKYHEIEAANFNVVQGYRLAKEIQTILQKRRAIKGEVARVNSVMSVLNSINVFGKLPEMDRKLNAMIEKDLQIRRDLNAKLTFEDLGVKLG